MRSLALLCMALLVLTISSCAPPRQSPQQDPFATVSERSAELKQQGQELYQQGRTREALDAFQRARLLSPTDDPEVDAMIDQLGANLAPTPVPITPTATALPATATPPPVTPTPEAQPSPELQPTPLASPTPQAAPAPNLAPAAPAPQAAPAAAAPAPPGAPAAAAPRQQAAPSVVYVPVPVTVPTAVPAAPPTPVATSAGLVIHVMGGPSAVAVDESGLAYIADRSGLVWVLDRAQPTLRRPYSVPGEAIALSVTPDGQRIFVATRTPAAVLELDTNTAQPLANVPLPADPVDVQFDADLEVLFVTLPERGSIERLDTRAVRLLEPITDLAVVTGMALDAPTHTLYVSQLGGALASIDARSGSVRARLQVSGVGLAGVASSGGRVYAINTPGQELVSFDPVSGEFAHIGLDAPPAGVIVGPVSGVAYVLEPTANAVVLLDPNSGAELGRASLANARVEEPTLDPAQLWPRPHLAITTADETLFVVGPSAGVVVRLSAAT